MTDCSSLCSSSRKPGNILCALLVHSMPFFDITCFCFVILSPLLFSRFSFSVCKDFFLLSHQEFGYLKIKRPILSCVFDRRSHSGCLYIFSIPFLSLWISVSPVSLPPPPKKKKNAPFFSTHLPSSPRFGHNAAFSCIFYYAAALPRWIQSNWGG